MEEEKVPENDHFILACLNNNKKTLLKLSNVKVLLDRRFYTTKRLIEEAINSITKEFLSELDKALGEKFEYLKLLESNMEQDSSALINVSEHPLEQNTDDLTKFMEPSKDLASKECMQALLSLEFMPSEVPVNNIGYLKSSPTRPEDLKLIVVNEAVKTGTEFSVLVQGNTEYYPLLSSLLSGYIEFSNGDQRKGKIKDNEDGSYLIFFPVENHGRCFISVTLYGRHIENSPTVFEIFDGKSTQINITDPLEEKSKLPSCPENNQRTIMDKSDGMPTPKVDDTLKGGEWCMTGKENYFYTESNLKGDQKEGNYSFFTEEKSIYSSDTVKENGDEEKNCSLKAQLIATVGEHIGIELNFPIGIAVNQRNEVIICDTGHHRVWIIEEHGKPIKVIKHENRGVNLFRPSAVGVLSNGDFAIKDNNGIHLYSPHGLYQRSAGKDILKRPFGLAVTKDDKLVTLEETENAKLYVFTNQGEVYGSGTYEPLINKPQGSKCRFMASFENEIVVSDLGLSKIYKTMLSGNTISTFGSYGRFEGAMIEPSGIAFDPCGTMLVADSRNDRVQIFDWSGEYMGVVDFSHPIHRPSDITLTRDGRLYVLNYVDHFLAVYRLEQE